MDTNGTWKSLQRWIAATTAAAALLVPPAADLAGAAAPGLPGIKGKGGSAGKGSFSTDKLERDPKPKLEAPVLVRLVTKGQTVASVSALDAEAVHAGGELAALVDDILETAAGKPGAGRKKLANLLRKKFQAKLQKRADAYEAAEAGLIEAEDSMWNGFDGSFRLPTVVDEPLAAALLQLQIELRRLLGVRMHTEVPNLREMPGCSGDLVRDRLIARYGEAILELGDDRSSEVEVLGQIATQLACLGTEQSRRLDYALYVAYYRAFDKLEKAGLARLQPAFARLTAPLMMLVLDTVKHRGHAAAAWYWFDEHHEILRDEVSRLGWATGGVYWLYDRMDGRLIGFPPCHGADLERCVLPDVLLDSLIDPAALGRGDCALSGMVAGGAAPMGGRGDRYSCPGGCDDAGSDSSNTRFGGKLGRGGLDLGGFGGSRFGGGHGLGNGQGSSSGNDLPWFGLTPDDLTQMQSGCGGSGAGGGEGGSSAQGPGGALGGWGGLEECMNEFLDQPRSPFHAYAQCVVDAVGSGNPALELGSPYGGVPMDPRCGLMDDEGTGTEGGTPPETEPKEEKSLGQKVWEAIKEFFGVPTSPSGPGAVVGVELELLDPENGKKIYDTAGAVIENRLELAHAAGDISDAEYEVLKDMKPGDVAEYMKNKGIRECASPEDCSDSCTALNAQLAATQECTEQFIEDMMPPEYQDGNDPHDPDHVINWGPDGNPNEAGQIDGVLGCMLEGGMGGGTDSNPQCGVVTCADGLATNWSASNCCQDLGSFNGPIPVSQACLQMQCADGNPSVGANGGCTCGGNDGTAVGTPTPQPAPGPELGGGPGGLRSPGGLGGLELDRLR